MEQTSDTMRVVLLSDTSKEFPENTSSAFKVRLAEPLQLEDGPWEVGLSSVSLPDASLNLDALTDDRTANLIEASYVIEYVAMKVATVSLADLDPFTNRVELMKVIIDQIQWNLMWNMQLSKKMSCDRLGPGFRWEGDNLILTRSNTGMTDSNYKFNI